ncbi:MAG: hypothetical protein RMJ43_06090 [Chloroherpetonaceae bacterium]|nr:hypothetical protein [Chloroherpetonaceae bacterium]
MMHNPSGDVERTQALTSSGADTADRDVLLQDEARRRQLETELARLGMSPEEVRRLLFARPDTAAPNAGPAAPGAPSTPLPAVVPLPQAGSIPATGAFAGQGSVQQLAAQAVARAMERLMAAIEEAARALPAFRESSAEEVRQAEALLRDAHLLRRREKYPEAIARCREAIDLVPKDASALELYGDLLQGVARIPEALAAYRQATLADPKRASAERKYGDLLMRQQQWDTGDPEAVPKNSVVAAMLSLIVPGAGQIYNGEGTKGLFFLLGTVVSLFLIFWSPWGLNSRQSGINPVLTATLIFVCVLYLISVTDAGMTARGVRSIRRARPGRGWEV